MTRFLFVYSERDFSWPDRRMSSQMLAAGLEGFGQSVGTVFTSEGTSMDGADVLLYHLNDHVLFETIQNFRSSNKCVTVCFICDAYEPQELAALYQYADLYVVPTRNLQLIISAASGRPTIVLPEGIDPIILPPFGRFSHPDASNRALWFGYPGSYAISFDPLVNALRAQRPDFNVRITAMSSTEIVSPLVSANVPFSQDHFYERTKPYSHAVLSHLPFDLRVNTFIKSPNKLITALVRGLVPIASATPSYREIAAAFGLEPLLFATPAEFAARLEGMDARAQREAFRLDEVRAELIDLLRPDRLTAHFLSASGL